MTTKRLIKNLPLLALALAVAPNCDSAGDQIEIETKAAKPGHVEGPAIQEPTIYDPMDWAIAFKVSEDAAGYSEAWGLGTNERGGAEWCSQRCTTRYRRYCNWVVKDGKLVKDESSCTALSELRTSCEPWVCTPGTTPPPTGGGSPAPAPPSSSPGSLVPGMSHLAQCSSCDDDRRTQLQNAETARDACDRAADKEARRRCRKAGVNVQDCWKLVKDGGPFGIEVEVPGAGIALTDLLPGGTPLSKYCSEEFNEATLTAQKNHTSCLSSYGCAMH